jgi:hypothetical protein
MQDKIVPIYVDDLTYKARVIRPYHFIECVGGIPFDLFDVSRQEVGKFAQMQADLDETRKKTGCSQEEIDRFRIVLDIAVFDFDFDFTIEKYGIRHIQDLFSFVIYNSLELFKQIIKPNNSMLVNCHYMASNYGGKPIDYINSPIDEYLFNFNCLIAGKKDEERYKSK